MYSTKSRWLSILLVFAMILPIVAPVHSHAAGEITDLMPGVAFDANENVTKFDQKGKAAYQFDGLGRLDSTEKVTVGSQMTLQFWVRPDNQPQGNMLLFQFLDEGGTAGRSLAFLREGKLGSFIAAQDVFTPGSQPLETWTNYAIQYDVAENTETLYVNGEKVTVDAIDGSLINQGQFTLRLGEFKKYQDGSNNLEGALSTVYYSQTLDTEEQIKARYEEEKPYFEEVPQVTLTFLAGDHASFEDGTKEKVVQVDEGTPFSNEMVPTVIPDEGYLFTPGRTSWTPYLPNEGVALSIDRTFFAEVELDPAHLVSVEFDTDRSKGSLHVLDPETGEYGPGSLDPQIVPTGTLFSEIAVPKPVPKEGHEFVRWEPELPSPDTALTEAKYKFKAIFNTLPEDQVTITFLSGDNATFEGGATEVVKRIDKYAVLTEDMIPEVIPNPGYTHGGQATDWTPTIPVGLAIDVDKTYTAKVERDPSMWTLVRFYVPNSEEGEIHVLDPETGEYAPGEAMGYVLKGTKFSEIEVPKAVAKTGYKFVGWNPELPAADTELTANSYKFKAVFEKDPEQWITITVRADETKGTLVDGPASYEIEGNEEVNEVLKDSMTWDEWNADTRKKYGVISKDGWAWTGFDPAIPYDDIRLTENIVLEATFKEREGDVDKAGLQKWYNFASEYLDEEQLNADYVPMLNYPLQRAKTVLDDEEATQEQVDGRIQDLIYHLDNQAYKEGYGHPDKSHLEEGLALAELLDTEGATEEQIAALNAAIEEAKLMLEFKWATQDQVNTANTALYDAMKAIDPTIDPEPEPVDKERLIALLDYTKDFDVQHATEATRTEFETARTEGIAARDSEEVTQEDVDNATAKLDAAIWALQYVGLEDKYDVTWIEDSNSEIIREGDFNDEYLEQSHGGSHIWGGESITYTMNGKGFVLITKTGGAAGINEIVVDGKLVGVDDQYAPVQEFALTVFVMEFEEAGEHTIHYRKSGKKNANSSNNFLNFDAIGVYSERLPELDLADLNAEIEKAEALNEKDYVDFSAVKEALREAKAFVASAPKDTPENQQEKANHIKALQDAMAALEEKPITAPEFTLTHEIIETPQGTTLTVMELLDNVNVEGDDWPKMKIEGYQDIDFETPGDYTITYVATNEGGETRKSATVRVLEASSEVDKSALKAKIEEAEALDLSGYTDESVKQLRVVLSMAKIVLGDDKATQEMVDSYVESIQKAVDALVEKVSDVDKTALRERIAEAEAIDEDKLTEDSKAILHAVLMEAKRIEGLIASTQADVDKAEEDLRLAIRDLEYKEEPTEVDKTELQKALEEAEGLDLEDKDPIAVAGLKQAMERAKAVLADEDALQSQVNEVLATLRNAIKGLKEAGEGRHGFYDAPAPLKGKVYYENDVQVFGWKDIDGRTFFFREGTGTMVTGWQYIDGYWRYFRDSGSMVKSRWEWLDSKWKFFNSKGESMDQFWEEKGKVWLSQAGPNTDYCKGWKTINGLRYFFRMTSGTRVEGWQYIDGYWRYFRYGSGSQAFGWQYIDGNWYFLRDNTGTRVTGRQYIDGRWYSFRANGTLIGDR